MTRGRAQTFIETKLNERTNVHTKCYRSRCYVSRVGLIIVSLRERIIKSGLLLFRAAPPCTYTSPIAPARTHRIARHEIGMKFFPL